MKPPLIDSALRDDNQLGDIAYISLGALMLGTVGPILFMCVMSAVAQFRCSPHEVIVKEVLTVIACPYDPQPLGSAIGYAAGGFGVALAALAGYMAATRRPAGSSTTTTRTQETVIAAPAAPAIVPPGEVVKVAVVDMPPADGKPNGKPKK